MARHIFKEAIDEYGENLKKEKDKLFPLASLRLILLKLKEPQNLTYNQIQLINKGLKIIEDEFNKPKEF